MKTKLSTILLAFTALAINLHAAMSLPATLPEFMSHDQLAKWNADQTSATQAVASSQETSSQFYTGKPYLADSGGYIFKYRTYNPEMNRWTSTDPSGFPDGANAMFYAPVPTVGLDATGLDQTVPQYQSYELAQVPGGISYLDLAIAGGLGGLAGTPLGGWGAFIGAGGAGYAAFSTAYSLYQNSINAAWPTNATVASPSGTNTYTQTETIPDNYIQKSSVTTLEGNIFSYQFDATEIEFDATTAMIDDFTYGE
jgi:RHS repeat-associated protein